MDLSKLSDADLTALQTGNLAGVSDVGLAQLAGAPVKQKTSVLDAPNAVATGVNQGLARFAGLPVDAIANVLDLGKAALGAPYTALTGKPAPDTLQVKNRADVAGSGDWLLKQADKTDATRAAVRAANSEYEGGYLQAAGAGVSGIFRPTGFKDAAQQVITNVTGAAAAKSVSDAGGSTSATIAAGMIPALLRRPQAAAPATAKRQVFDAGRLEGYVAQPSHTGAGWFNNRLESIAGKAALKQDAIIRNQEVTNKIAGREIGLQPGEQLSVPGLEARRAEAGRKGYAPINQISDIPITPNYADQIVGINTRIGNPSSAVTSLRYPDVGILANELLPPSFSGPDINNTIKQLRETGNKGLAIPYGSNLAGQKLAQAQIAGSKALENLVDEHLMHAGPSNTVHNLRSARQEIGQLHTLEQALNKATRDVDPVVYRERAQAGKPLQGGFKTIGDFAAAFPDVMKAAAGTPTPGVSMTEAAGVPVLALAGNAASGNAAGMLAGGLPLLRAPVRNMLLSKWYQKHFANPKTVSTALTAEDMGALSKFLTTNGLLETPQ